MFGSKRLTRATTQICDRNMGKLIDGKSFEQDTGKVFGYKDGESHLLVEELSDSRRVSGGQRDGWRLLSAAT